MSSGITTTIKIKPYLREFILNRYLDGKYQCSADDPLGTTIKPFLTVPPANIMPLPSDSDDSYFSFEIPSYHDKQPKYCYVTPYGQRYVEKIFELLFRDAMFHFIYQNIEVNGGQIKDWIINWCGINNITFEVLNYDTLKKAYYRYEVDQEKKEKTKIIGTRSFPCISPQYHFIVPPVSRPCPANIPTVKINAETELETANTQSI
jgi:hypothetical protein